MRSIIDVSASQIYLFYSIVFCFFLYSLYKFRKDYFFVLLVFIFYIGLFVFIGKTVQNIYRIVILLFAIYIAIKTIRNQDLDRDSFIIFSFISFSVGFLLSSIINEDSLTLMLSQYSRYLMIVLFYFILKRKMVLPLFRQRLNYVIFHLILVQIILAVLKFFLIGPMESIVSSLSYNGGAIATVFPLLAFSFLWMYRSGNFSKKDWLLVLGLLFIGYVNYKRAIWFILPLYIWFLMVYVQKRRVRKFILLLVVLIPLMVYLGIRLNPTLNKEQKVWGSFDIDYAFNYAREYSFGKQDDVSAQKTGSGRGGATKLLFNKLLQGDITSVDLFGQGLELMYVEGAKDETEFTEKYSLNSIGAANGFFQFYVVFGFLGTLLTLLFVFSLVRNIPSQRFRIILAGLFAWEFFFYTGIILREPALSFLFVFLILNSRYGFHVKTIGIPSEQLVRS